ncbi:acyl carrier protein [Streptosporangium lutulentum]
MPRSRRDVESAVLGVWARVLDLPAARIGPHDRFFALGGSSLKAMQVLAAVEDVFGVSCGRPTCATTTPWPRSPARS